MKDIIKGITKLIFKIIRFVLSYYFQMFLTYPLISIILIIIVIFAWNL
ncbi:hypothetical protein KZA77_008005 [Streptococcus constellatus]